MTATPPRSAFDGAIETAEEALAETGRRVATTLDHLLRIPEPAASRWHRAGVSPRVERTLDVAGALLLVVLAAGWSWSVAMARDAASDDPGYAGEPVTSGIAAALTSSNAPTAAYLTDAAVEIFTPLRGSSGKLRATIQRPGADLPVGDTLPAGASVAFTSGAGRDSTTEAQAPERSGVWQLALKLGSAIKPITDLSVITLKPLSDRRGGRIGLYYIGTWPTERRGSRAPAKGSPAKYAPPSGFIEVTRENQGTPVSDHFALRDFLTHDQQDVWPKYLVLDTHLVDKLELVLSDLESRGVNPSGVRVMSGFRTPQYNASGGDPSGRAGLSRHMYGDAADIFIDDDHDGVMDDLDHDHRVTIHDAEVVLAAVDRVERAHPELVGGCGVYVANGSHGPFVHIDTRGYRARWVGTGDS